MATLAFSVPGVVYDATLDPKVTNYPTDVALPTPHRVKRGKGYQFIYNVDPATRADMIVNAWVWGDGVLVGSSSDDLEGKAEARAVRTWAIKNAEKYSVCLW